MQTVNKQTEKEYRDSQSTFGHIHQGLNLESWLTLTYENDVIRRDRYHGVAGKFLHTTNKLRVLEIAAGIGDFVMYCKKNFPIHEYSAHELSRVQLESNISRVAHYFGISEIPTLSFSPAEELEYDDGVFDVVFIKASVHHFEDPQKSFGEIHRVLKPGGVVVFFEDPICLNVPIYRDYIKKNFSLAERKLGINEHIYTTNEYLGFGEKFSETTFYIDPVLISEFDTHQAKRSGIKKILGSLLRSNYFLFTQFMIWRFSSVVFVFKK